MRITPIEITNKEFKKTMRGYSVDEVDEFLDEIVEEFEGIYRENVNLKEKIETNAERLKHYEDLEKTLQNTLVLAQNTADATKDQAGSEAKYIIDNANNKAKMIIEKANLDKEQIVNEYEKYKMEFSNLKVRVENFLKSQLNFFVELSEEIEEDSFGKEPNKKFEKLESKKNVLNDNIKDNLEEYPFQSEILNNLEDSYDFEDEEAKG